MIKHRCGTMDCLNKIKYHNELEDCYYCKHCTIHMFKKGECAKIGSIDTIKQLLTLSKSMLDKLHGYIIDNQLEVKWSLVLDQHKIFFDELITTNNDLDNILKADKIKDLAKIQQKSSNLKCRITESEAFMKYLLHKEMNKHRLREKINEAKHIKSNICKDHNKIQTEEEREAIFESFHKLKKLMYPNPSSNPELEELEIKHKREIKAIKKEMNELQDQKIQLEQELNEIKQRQADTETEENSEIYDAVSEIYKKNKGEDRKINSNSNLKLCLDNDRDVSFLKEFSNITVPKLNELTLNYILKDNEDLKYFMRNSALSYNSFCFNKKNDYKIESSIYISSFCDIASKTLKVLSIYNTNFSQKDFEKLIIFSKNIEKVLIAYSKINLEKGCDFRGNMEGCKIKCLDFTFTEGLNYNHACCIYYFERLLNAISKCLPLKQSLKTIVFTFLVKRMNCINNETKKELNKIEFVF